MTVTLQQIVDQQSERFAGIVQGAVLNCNHADPDSMIDTLLMNALTIMGASNGAMPTNSEDVRQVVRELKSTMMTRVMGW